MSGAARPNGSVLIHVDERRRDIPLLLALRRLLEQRGFRVILSTRRTTAAYLRGVPVDAIVVPSLLHLPYDELPRICARSKIYMLPTEGALFEELPLLVKYGGGTDPKRWARQIQATTRFFLWGEYSRRVLRATGRFRDDQLVVVGAPRMDFFLVDPSAEERARHAPRSLGLLSDFVLLNSYHPRPIFELTDGGRHCHGIYHAPTRGIEDRFWIEMAWMRVWLELLEECQKRQERLRLRIHPREDLGNYRYLEARYGEILGFEDPNVPFESWLERVEILLGYNSTAFFEVVAANKPAINLEGLVGPRLAEHVDGFQQSHYPVMDHIPTPGSLEELFRMIRRMRDGQWVAAQCYGAECRALLQDVCHYPRSTAALAAVVQTIVDDLEGAGLDKRWSHRVAGALGGWEAKALEAVSFTVLRNPVTSMWFPMRDGRFARQHAAEIARYVRAAERFPASGSASDEVAERCAAS